MRRGLFLDYGVGLCNVEKKLITDKNFCSFV